MKTTLEFRVTGVQVEERYTYPDGEFDTTVASRGRHLTFTTLVTMQGPEKPENRSSDSINLRFPSFETPFKYGEPVKVTFETT